MKPLYLKDEKLYSRGYKCSWLTFVNYEYNKRFYKNHVIIDYYKNLELETKLKNLKSNIAITTSWVEYDNIEQKIKDINNEIKILHNEKAK